MKNTTVQFLVSVMFTVGNLLLYCYFIVYCTVYCLYLLISHCLSLLLCLPLYHVKGCAEILRELYLILKITSVCDEKNGNKAYLKLKLKLREAENV